jgi:hypothetical protein
MLREAGLEEVGVEVRRDVYPVGHTRRTIVPDLVRALRPGIVGRLRSDKELDELDRAVRTHLEDPHTLVLPILLFLAWGRKPDFTAANCMLRSRDREYLKAVVDKVRQIAEGAALETGARLEVLPYYPFPTPRGTHVMYENARRNAVLNRIARANANAAGFVVHEPSIERNMGGASSDFGNISQIMPAEAIRFAVSEQLIPGHSLAMRDAAITDLAHYNALAVAKTLALTALDVLADAAVLDDVRGDFAGTNGNS